MSQLFDCHTDSTVSLVGVHTVQLSDHVIRHPSVSDQHVMTFHNGGNAVNSLDVYRKVPKDLTEPTIAGAVISVCSLTLIVFLFISELVAFISTET